MNIELVIAAIPWKPVVSDVNMQQANSTRVLLFTSTSKYWRTQINPQPFYLLITYDIIRHFHFHNEKCTHVTGGVPRKRNRKNNEQ